MNYYNNVLLQLPLRISTTNTYHYYDYVPLSLLYTIATNTINLLLLLL